MVAISLLLLGTLGSAVASSARAGDTITIDASTARSLGHGPIAADFTSFSYEVSCAPGMFLHNGAPRATFVALMQQLAGQNGGVKGPNIRIGGNSADESAFVPPPSPLPYDAKYRITPADFAAYLAAVPLWNGSITPGLNFRGGGNATLERAHAVALAAAIPWESGLVEALEQGNECDLYVRNGDRPAGWGAADYNREASAVMADLAATAGVPPQRFQGLTFCCHNLDSIVDTYAAANKAHLRTLSYHEYALSVCEGQHNTIFQLLSNDVVDRPLARLAPILAAARAIGVPFVIGEGNSVSCGGQANVSDVFAAALWAVDALLAHAAIGVTRWNFHGCEEGAYTAIAYADTALDAPVVRPLFYGMFAFTHATRGGAELYGAAVSSSNPLVRGYAARTPAGAWAATVVHKDVGGGGGSARVSVALPSGVSATGVLVRLQSAAGPLARTGVTFRGLTWDGTTTGLPSGTPKEEQVGQGADGRYTFDVEQGSVAVLTVGA
jgi:hypothetical protein